jgi:hypothetical protein
MELLLSFYHGHTLMPPGFLASTGRTIPPEEPAIEIQRDVLLVRSPTVEGEV